MLKNFFEKSNYIVMLFSLLTIIGYSTYSGCTSASRSQWSAYGNDHHIELWSGGTKIKEWVSDGKVFSEESSDGYYFRDKDSGKLVRVTGTLIITLKD